MNHLAHVCPTCGRKISGSKRFDGFTANLFICAVCRAKDTYVEWKADRANPKSPTKREFLRNVILSRDIRNSLPATSYARFGDLKYWGLLRQNPEHWHQGIYQLTPLSKDFINGIARIPKIIVVANGKVLERSEETIDLRTALGSKWNEIAEWVRDWRNKNANWDEGNGQGRLF